MIYLVSGAHPSRGNYRFTGLAVTPQQAIVGQTSGCDFIAWWIELLYEVHGCSVPAGRKPSDIPRPAVSIDLSVVISAEFNLVSVLKVSNQSPRSVTQDIALLRRYTYFRCALLKFDCITPCEDSRVDQVPGKINTAVVVEADLGHDVNGLCVANQSFPKCDLPRHSSPFTAAHSRDRQPVYRQIEPAPNTRTGSSRSTCVLRECRACYSWEWQYTRHTSQCSYPLPQ